MTWDLQREKEGAQQWELQFWVSLSNLVVCTEQLLAGAQKATQASRFQGEGKREAFLSLHHL